MTGFLAFIKALFPFIKEIYSNDDQIDPKDRKQKIGLFVFMSSALFLGYMGTLYKDHVSIVNDSEIEILNARLEVSEKSKEELEHQLLQERSYGSRVELALERSNRQTEELANTNRDLEKQLNTLLMELREKERLANTCINPDSLSAYDRVLRLFGDKLNE